MDIILPYVHNLYSIMHTCYQELISTVKQRQLVPLRGAYGLLLLLMCAPHIILIVDFGPSIKKPLHYLCLSLQSSYSQWHREGRSLRGCIGRGKEVCEGSSHHYTHTSLPTVVARLGSALLFSKMSTICVWPYSLATYTELNPSYRQNSTHIRTCIYSGIHVHHVIH